MRSSQFRAHRLWIKTGCPHDAGRTPGSHARSVAMHTVWSTRNGSPVWRLTFAPTTQSPCEARGNPRLSDLLHPPIHTAKNKNKNKRNKHRNGQEISAKQHLANTATLCVRTKSCVSVRTAERPRRVVINSRHPAVTVPPRARSIELKFWRIKRRIW